MELLWRPNGTDPPRHATGTLFHLFLRGLVAVPRSLARKFPLRSGLPALTGWRALGRAGQSSPVDPHLQALRFSPRDTRDLPRVAPRPGHATPICAIPWVIRCRFACVFGPSGGQRDGGAGSQALASNGGGGAAGSDGGGRAAVEPGGGRGKGPRPGAEGKQRGDAARVLGSSALRRAAAETRAQPGTALDFLSSTQTKAGNWPPCRAAGAASRTGAECCERR